MIQAYQHWPTIRHPRAWTRRVASRAYTRRLASIEDLVPSVASNAPLLAVETDVAAWEQRHDVLRILAFLPPRQRQVMAWTLDGYTPSEIAKELIMTPEAVRTNLVKANRSLAAYISVARVES